MFVDYYLDICIGFLVVEDEEEDISEEVFIEYFLVFFCLFVFFECLVDISDFCFF